MVLPELLPSGGNCMKLLVAKKEHGPTFDGQILGGWRRHWENGNMDQWVGTLGQTA